MSARQPILLLVDDDRFSRRLLSATFQSGKYQIFEAQNGPDAVDLAQRQHPDVVLLDVMLVGEFDGLEACRRIKALPAPPRVVLLTALGQQRDRELGMAAGADAYLTKPFQPSRLIELVDSLL